MLEPELLTHPNIPKPLHGLNPRTLLGKAWWDEKRQEAYTKYNYHCWGCGVAKEKAKYHQWLEGHEHYIIDYCNGRMELREIVALCHSCHNFVHSGSLWKLYTSGKIDKAKITEILLHGFGILRKSKLRPFVGTIAVWCRLHNYSLELTKELMQRGSSVPKKLASWEDWHLVIGGKEYYSLYESFSAWQHYYSKENGGVTIVSSVFHMP